MRVNLSGGSGALLLGGLLVGVSLLGMLVDPARPHNAAPDQLAALGVPDEGHYRQLIAPPVTPAGRKRFAPTPTLYSPPGASAANGKRAAQPKGKSPAAQKKDAFLVPVTAEPTAAAAADAVPGSTLPAADQPTPTPQDKPATARQNAEASVGQPDGGAQGNSTALGSAALGPLPPDRIVIPAIQLDAWVLPSNYQLVTLQDQVFQQWEAPPGFAAGWQTTSAPLGAAGNTVLNGHNNIYAAVFARLVDLNVGDEIQMFAGSAERDYQISERMILPEPLDDLNVRLENARWLLPTDDERVTLVTCWPPDSNTHRLIIVAKPVQ